MNEDTEMSNPSIDALDPMDFTVAASSAMNIDTPSPSSPSLPNEDVKPSLTPSSSSADTRDDATSSAMDTPASSATPNEDDKPFILEHPQSSTTPSSPAPTPPFTDPLANLWSCPVDLCDKSFAKRFQLNKHVNTHYPRYACSFDCGMKFAVKRDRDRHDNDVHMAEVKHMCPIKGCRRRSRGFKRDDNLLRHLEKVHHLSREERQGVRTR